MNRKALGYLFGFLVSFGLLAWVTLPAVGSNLFQMIPSEGKAPEFKMESITKYTDALPIPVHIKPDPVSHELTIHLKQFSMLLQKDLPNPTTLWGYEGMTPGPIIDVEAGEAIVVHWKNELPTTAVLATPPGAMRTGPIASSRIVYAGPQSAENDNSPMPPMGTPPPAGNLPEVRNITHLHGAAVPETNPLDRLFNNDGWPDAWNVPGQEQISYYPNVQDARMLWYHDHAFGVTGRNVASGLYGAYMIHDKFERSLNLPSGEYEIPLIFQAMGIKPDGSNYYTNFISNEFYGNFIAVNGKLLPYLNVEPRKYRFRMLNASNARMLGLGLLDAKDLSTPGPAFYQIGSDAGFLAKTAVMNDPNAANSPQLFLASAERADVIIDFSAYAGRSFELTNTNAITDHDGELAIPAIMQFNIGSAVSKPDTSSLPMNIRSIGALDPTTAAQTRQIELTETDFPDGSSLFRLDHRAWSFQKTDKQGDYWDYEIDKEPVLGSTEVWELANTSPLMHPFHVHLVQFQIIDRRPFDIDQYKKTKQIVFTGNAQPPEANEAGWKDVVRSPSGFVTRIIMQFGPYPGYFVYHCHILEHEDMDMMVPFHVVEPK